MNADLLKMPEPFAHVGKFLDDSTPVYTADQMREFANEAARLAMEEVDRLKEVIRVHDQSCVMSCEARRKAGPSYCHMLGYDRECSDCPRDWTIGDCALADVAGEKGVGND